MKGRDLLSNIQQARDHITRLKREASLLEQQPSEPHEVQEFVSEAYYALVKQEKQIEKQHQQQKDKLPTISKKQDQLPSPSGQAYAPHRRKNKHSYYQQHKREQSTRVEDSFSLLVENRPAKMHSFQEKLIKPDISPQDRPPLQIPDPEPAIKRTIPSSAHFRARHVDRRNMRGVDFGSSKQRDRSSRSMIAASGGKNSFHLDLIAGKVDYDSKEFSVFQRVYASVMTKLMESLGRLEAILDFDSIAARAVDGKKLAYLCLKPTVSKEELIDCLIDSSLVLPPRPPTSKYAGKEGKIKAANKIIAFWRMRSIRTKYLTLKNNTMIIQRFFRQQLLRLGLESKLRKRNNEMMEAFEKRQIRFSKQFKGLRDQKRIEVHLCSVEVDQEKRLSMDHFWQRQNAQLARLFRLKDENLVLIIVTGRQLSSQLLNYYYRMLELAGINDHRERLIFMTPELANRLPAHLSTARLLYYSSRTLNQLKMIISDLPTVLYPGQPCNQLLKICDYLDCYLYGGQPQRMKSFMVKSQCKRLLKNLCIQTLPSVMEMYDYGEFLNTFSVQVARNPNVQQWVLKIDDEWQGRGLAVLDLSTSKTVRNLLRRLTQGQAQEQGTFATQIRDDPQTQEVTVRIRDYFREHLSEKLQISTPSVYRNYSEFMGRFLKKGGIIEAHPNCPRQQLASIAATFDMDPLGEFTLVSCYEKITTHSHRTIASSFPQNVMPTAAIHNVIRQLCDAFKLRKIFGVFTVDFLVKGQEYWVLGIQPYLNDHAASFYVFDLLMNGAYMPEKQIYLVNGAENSEEEVQTRECIFIPHMFHTNLSRVKIKDFFKAARLEQFNFDMGNHQGVCVTLLDQLTSGGLGLLSVAPSREQATEIVKKMLDFISRVSNVKNVDYGRSDLDASSDSVGLKDVLSVFTGFVRKGARKGAKQRAIKHHEMNGALELLI